MSLSNEEKESYEALIKQYNLTKKEIKEMNEAFDDVNHNETENFLEFCNNWIVNRNRNKGLKAYEKNPEGNGIDEFKIYNFGGRRTRRRRRSCSSFGPTRRRKRKLRFHSKKKRTKRRRIKKCKNPAM